MFGENMLGREHDLVEVAASLQTRKVDRPKGDGRNCLVGCQLSISKGDGDANQRAWRGCRRAAAAARQRALEEPEP